MGKVNIDLGAIYNYMSGNTGATDNPYYGGGAGMDDFGNVLDASGNIIAGDDSKNGMQVDESGTISDGNGKLVDVKNRYKPVTGIQAIANPNLASWVQQQNQMYNPDNTMALANNQANADIAQYGKIATAKNTAQRDVEKTNASYVPQNLMPTNSDGTPLSPDAAVSLTGGNPTAQNLSSVATAIKGIGSNLPQRNVDATGAQYDAENAAAQEKLTQLLTRGQNGYPVSLGLGQAADAAADRDLSINRLSQTPNVIQTLNLGTEQGLNAAKAMGERQVTELQTKGLLTNLGYQQALDEEKAQPFNSAAHLAGSIMNSFNAQHQPAPASGPALKVNTSNGTLTPERMPGGVGTMDRSTMAMESGSKLPNGAPLMKDGKVIGTYDNSIHVLPQDTSSTNYTRTANPELGQGKEKVIDPSPSVTEAPAKYTPSATLNSQMSGYDRGNAAIGDALVAAKNAVVTKPTDTFTYDKGKPVVIGTDGAKYPLQIGTSGTGHKYYYYTDKTGKPVVYNPSR